MAPLRDRARHSRGLSPALAIALVVTGGAGAALSAPAHAGAAGAFVVAGGAPWLSLGVLGGSARPDPALGGYQWSTAPEPAWGIQARAGIDRWSAGLRLWRTGADQDLGAASPSVARVRATHVELGAGARIARLAGTEVLALASAGRMHLGYDPDRATVESGSGPVSVSFAPIDAWTFGGGLGLTRPLAAHWTVGLEIDHRRFGLDTAHRAGSTIETRRESFGEWSGLVELAWNTRRR